MMARSLVVLMCASLASCAEPAAAPVRLERSVPTQVERSVAKPDIEVAVTVDDLPIHGPSYPGIDRLAIAEAILTAFAKHRLPAVYGFVNGKKVDDDPTTLAILSRWVAAGNPLGNHTYSHISLNEASVADYLTDLERGEEILRKTMTDQDAWRVFRYPYLFEGPDGKKRAAVREHLAQHHYRIADVTIDGDDWAWNPPFARCKQQADAAAVAELRRGYVKTHVSELRYIRGLTQRVVGRDVKHILLLHIGAADADAMDELLTALEAEGVRFIDLPTALTDPIYTDDPDQPMKAGASLPYKMAKAKGIPFGQLPPRPEEDALEATCR